MANNRNNVKRTAMTLNSPWLKNTLKSMGMASSEVIRDLMPATSETFTSTADLSREAIQTIRNNRGTAKIGTALQNNKYVKLGRDFFKNAVEDLKTGDFYSDKSDDYGGMDDIFGDLDDFLSDEDSNINVQTNVIQTDNSATLKMMKQQTEYQVKSSKATVETMVSIASASIANTNQIGMQVLSELSTINKNLSALIDYQNTNMTKFIEASIGYYEQMSRQTQNESSSSKIKQENIFGSSGGLDVRSYKEYVKQNIKSMETDSLVGSMVQSIIDTPEILAHPMSLALTEGMKALMPSIVKESMTALDNAMQDVVPVVLERIGNLDKIAGSGPFGINSIIAKVFGIKTTRKTDYDTSKIEKGPMPYNGIANHTIVEIIPKYLRESNNYLREIAMAVTKKSGSDLDKNAMGYNWQTGKFQKTSDIKDELFEQVLTEVVSTFERSNFGKKLSSKASHLKSEKDASSYGDALTQLYSAIERHEGMLDFTDDKALEQILSEVSASNNIKNLIKASIMEMRSTTEGQGLLGNAMNTKRLATHKKNSMQEYQEQNASENGLYQIDGSYDDWIKQRYQGSTNATINKGRGKKQSVDDFMKSFQENPDLMYGDSKEPSKFVGVLNGIMSGNADAAWDSFIGAVGDKFKKFGNFISENFLNPIKNTLFGQKDQNGYMHGGLFEGVNNRMRDSFNSLRRMITGKGYVDADGNKVEDATEDELKNTVIGKLKSMVSGVTSAISVRLFGEKTEDGEEGEKKGLLNKFKSGIYNAGDSLIQGLHGWKVALFGESEDGKEESPKKTLENLKNKVKDVLPDGLTGSLVGAGVGLSAGGFLGTLIGGPIGGALLGFAGGIVSKSTKFQNWLFGETDENGERAGGVISKDVQNYVKENGKFLGGGAALGAISGAFTGGGFLGTLVGGPIAGALMGIGSSIILRSETFKKFLYGDEEHGQLGLIKTVKNMFSGFGKVNGKASGGKMAGMLGIGAGVGAITLGAITKAGILGLSLGPAGPIGGAILGLGAGILAQKDNFKEWLFGKKDEDGNKTEEGVIGKFKNMLIANVLHPMVNLGKDIGADFKTFLKYDVFEKFNLMIEPIGNAIFGTISDIAGKTMDSFAEVGNFIKEDLLQGFIEKVGNILSPITHAASAVAKGMYTIGKKIVTFPLDALYALTSPISQSIGKAMGAVIKGTATVVDKVLIKPMTNLVLKPLGAVVKGTFSLIAKPFQALGNFAESVTFTLKKQLAHVGRFIGVIGDKIGEKIKEPFIKAGEYLHDKIDGAKDFLRTTFVDPIKEKIHGVLNFVKEKVTGFFKKAFGGLLSVLTSPFKLLGKGVGSLLGAIGNKVSGGKGKLSQIWRDTAIENYSPEVGDVDGLSNADRRKLRIQNKKAELERNRAESRERKLRSKNERMIGKATGYKVTEDTEENRKLAQMMSGKKLKFKDVDPIVSAQKATMDATLKEETATRKATEEIKDYQKESKNILQSIRDILKRKLGFADVPRHADGTNSAKKGYAIVGEAGPEVVYHRKNKFGKFVGLNGPEVVNMEGGETVIPNHKIARYEQGTPLTGENLRALREKERDAEAEKEKRDNMFENIKGLFEGQTEHRKSWLKMFGKTGLLATGAIWLFSKLKNLGLGGLGTLISNAISGAFANFGFAQNGGLGDGKNSWQKIGDEINTVKDVATNLGDGDLVSAAQSFIYDENGNRTHQTGARAKLVNKTVAKGANKVKTAASNVISAFGDNAVAEVVSEGAEEAAKVAESANKGIIDDVVKAIKAFFDGVVKKVGSKLGKKVASTKVGGFMSKVIKTVTSSKVVTKVVTKVGAILGATAALASTVVGLAAKEVTWVTLGAISGATGAKRLFRTDSVDGLMVIISTALGAFAGTTIGSICDVVNEIITSVIGVDMFTELATLLYSFLAGEDKATMLKTTQDAFKDQYSSDREASLREQYDTMIEAGLLDPSVSVEDYIEGALNGQYGAKIQSFADYNDDKHKTVGAKIGSAFGAMGKGIGKGFSAVFGSSKKGFTDSKGNSYIDNGDGSYQVYDKSGKSLGMVSGNAIPDDIKANKQKIKTKGWVQKAGDAVINGAVSLGTGIGKKAGELGKGFKNIETFIKKEKEFGEKMLTDKNVSLSQIFKVDSGQDNPLSGMLNVIAIASRISASPIAIIRKVGQSIGDGITNIKNNVKNTFSPVTDAIAKIKESADKGDLAGVWSEQLPETDKNPLSFFTGATLVGAKLINSVPAIVKFVGGKIGEAFDAKIKSISSNKSAFDSANAVLASYAKEGDISSIWKSNLSLSTDDPLNKIWKIAYTISRLFNTIVGLFNVIAKPVGEAVDAAKEWVGDKVEGVVNGYNTAKEWAGNAYNSAKTTVGNAATTVGNWAASAASNAWNTVGSWFGGSGGGTPEMLNGSPYYSQNDSRWANRKFLRSDGRDDGGTMGNSGCGPTAMAMAISHMRGNVSPLQLARLAQRTGSRDDTGTNWNFIGNAASAYGLSSSMNTNPTSDMISQGLSYGNPMVLSGKDDGTIYTPSGHYVVAVGKDANGNIIINDPRGESYSRRVSPDKLASATNASWMFGNGGFGKFINKFKHGGRGGLEIVKAMCTENACYRANQKLEVQGIMLHSVGCPQPSAETFANKFNTRNPNGRSVCVHAFIDANTGVVYQTMPWDVAAWHSGGKANSTHIGIEMCEPDCLSYTGGSTFQCTNKERAMSMVKTTYDSAVQLCASLCKQYGLNPLEDGVILSHAEGNRRGIASAHGDPEHLWKQVGTSYSMDKFRSDVSKAMGTAASIKNTASNTLNVLTDVGGALATFGSTLFNAILTGNYDSSVWKTAFSDGSSDGSSSTSATLSGSTIKEKVWNFFKSKGLSNAAIAGIMGNLEAESGIMPNNLQNSFNTSLGMSDSEYTDAVNSGKYSKSSFIKDKAGYGLAQWTSAGRKQGLYELMKSTGRSIDDLDLQLEWLWQELNSSYPKTMGVLRSTSSVKDASNAMLLDFERPKDQSIAVQNKRASLSQGYMDLYGGGSGTGATLSNRKYANLTTMAGGRGDTVSKLQTRGLSRTYMSGGGHGSNSSTDIAQLEYLLRQVVGLLGAISTNTNNLSMLKDALRSSSSNLVVNNMNTTNVSSGNKNKNNGVAGKASQNEALARRIAFGQ